MAANPLPDRWGRVAALVDLVNSVCAQISDELVAAGREEVSELIARGVTDPDDLERVVKDRAGRALRVSPTVAGRHLRQARDLHDGLDHVRCLFAAGRLDRDRVADIADATRHLSSAERAQVDQRLSASKLETLSRGRVRNLAAKLAAEVAPEAFAARVRAARKGRYVSVRPSREDGMAVLSAHLPLEQGVSCFATLDKAVKELWCSPEPVTRTRSQIMADTLVERLTGQTTADAVNVEILAMVPVESLLDPASPLPAELPGYGPLPVELLASREGQARLRRVFTRDGAIIGGESRSRGFRGTLATLITARDDGRCTAPYCDAPIRHVDHRLRYRDGGPTSFRNGHGSCEFHNHVREIGSTPRPPPKRRASHTSKGACRS